VVAGCKEVDEAKGEAERVKVGIWCCLQFKSPGSCLCSSSTTLKFNNENFGDKIRQ
jgi:hypothetical protein